METHDEPESCVRESFNCPHFQRNTCLIHFTCCDEWYPCQRCHNEALERQENDKPSADNAEDNFVEIDKAEGEDDLGRGSSNATGVSHELEGAPNGEIPETATDYDISRTGNGKVLSGMEEEYLVSGENIHSQQNTILCGEEEESDTPETSLKTETSLSNLNGLEEWCFIGEKSISSARSSGQAAEGAGKHEGMKDDLLTSDVKEESPHTTNGSLKQLKKNDEIYVRKNVMQGNDESNSHLTLVVKKEHAPVEARDGDCLKCTACGHIQSKFCQKCENESCGKTFSSYFCPECKLLIESGGSAKLQPYHCGPCGVCRLKKGEHFHCDTCNVCMPLSLREHKCFDNRGHDLCAICFEEVFSGAVILPCFHMIHEDCGEKLILSGSTTCPMCRGAIMQNKGEAGAVVEESQTNHEVVPNREMFCTILKFVSTNAYKIYETICRCPRRATPNEVSTATVYRRV